MKLFFCIVLSVVLCSCGSMAPSTVHAQNAVMFSPAHQEQVCPTGCIALQSPIFLELRLGPMVNTAQAGFSVTLDRAMHISMLDVWIGTQSGHIFESDSRLQIMWPNGDFTEFKAQFDKHGDNGKEDVQRSFSVSLDLPAGTILQVYHSEQGIISCPSSGCGYDTTWSLYGIH